MPKALLVTMTLLVLLKETGAIAGVEEVYARPAIADVEPKAFSKPNPDWDIVKLAHVRFLASVYFYPDNYDFFFLMRDAETAYDMATILLEGKKFHNRIHELNVSRDSAFSENLWGYLNSEGLNSNDPNKTYLLFDTGMNGKIPDRIRATQPVELKNKIQAQFFMSANPSYPSSRVYLSTVDPAGLVEPVGNFEGEILKFENIPHYTYSSRKYVLDSKTRTWKVITAPTYRVAGLSMMNSIEPAAFGYGGENLAEKSSRDPRNARRYMKDVKAFVLREDIQREFDWNVRIWKSLNKAYANSVATKNSTPLKTLIQSIRANKSRTILANAIISDAIEIIRVNAPLGKIKDIDKIKAEHEKFVRCELKLSK